VLLRRALNQAARELLLAQSSDWPFILATGTTTPYATRRFNEHIIRFQHLYEQLKAGEVGVDYLERLESEDNLFPEIDYRVYAA
jgi:1,4-alpha-glucan branching enzyme